MELKLSKFQETDFELYYRLVSNDGVMAQITERTFLYDEAKISFQKLINRNEKYDSFGSYKIYDYLDKTFIGLGHLTINEDRSREAEIGYMLLPEYWGKGYGTETAKKLLEIAKPLDLKVITAIIDPANNPSRKILSNLGFISQEFCEIDGLPGEILHKQF
ncbi:GNAT family N-acetyltransferase [Sporosarcina aquimarina]|uniref:GNAT family N-acetyltransferase n=1 Tax=Sporosarcina aquimarina TaxID=114975 RepID=UPI0020406CE1|nr:GNAT family N-acetyltransferase [Sporosarcina aquimarina]MCM3759014.1 GNAT family N-acetyltransferase [Sporosarcina aquimarina]